MRSSATRIQSVEPGGPRDFAVGWVWLHQVNLAHGHFLGVGLREYFELQHEIARLMLSLRCSWPHMIVVHQSIHVCKIHVAGDNILYA